MKWTNNRIEELKELAIAGKSNVELATHFNVSVTEIYAVRSRSNLTIAKLAAATTEKSEKSEPHIKLDAESVAKPILGLPIPNMDTRMKMRKAIFVECFSQFIRECSGEDIAHCILNPDGESVTVVFYNGHNKQVNVAGDSNLAMIIDICRACM